MSVCLIFALVIYSDDCMCWVSGHVLISGTIHGDIGIWKAFVLSKEIAHIKLP